MVEELFAVFARAAEWRLCEFNAKELAIIAWVCARVGRSDAAIFKMLARPSTAFAMLYIAFLRLCEVRTRLYGAPTRLHQAFIRRL